MKNNSNGFNNSEFWQYRKELTHLFFIVLLSRVPFLFCGYGIEEDSWGIALAAFHTHISGVYEPSRLPGHPVQELIYSALWCAGPIMFNGLCAVYSAISVLFFALILKHFKFKHYFIGSLAFAFIPVYFISSAYTIDFVWTEAFVLISFYCLLKNKLIACGAFLGLAIGCRITSGAMLLPYILLIWQQNNIKESSIRFLKIVLPMAFVAILAFIPVVKQFGLSFFMYYDQFPYPPISKVLYKMTLGVFGFVGLIAIIVGMFMLVLNRNKRLAGSSFGKPIDKKIIVSCFIIILLFTISYFRLPQKSGYIIPIIPFIILLFGYFLNSKQFVLICIGFIISPFVCSINLTDKLRGAEHSNYAKVFTISGQELFFDPFTGPLFSDYSKRQQKIKYTKDVINKADSINSKTVIIAGWWYNEIMVTLIPLNKNKWIIYEPYIDSNKINKYLADGYQLYYLSEQNIYNDQMYKMAITNRIAKEFNVYAK